MNKRIISVFLFLSLFASLFSGIVSAEAGYFDEARRAIENGTYQPKEYSREQAEELFENSSLYALTRSIDWDNYFSMRQEQKKQADKITVDVYTPDFSAFHWWETKDSTCFSYVGYDEDLEELAVIFRSNETRIYVYDDFTAADFDDFFSASSLGKYYNKYIKGSYECTRYDDTGTAIFK